MISNISTCILNFHYRSGVLQCCFGYVWNSIENRCIRENNHNIFLLNICFCYDSSVYIFFQCLACEDGYFGQNCSDPCPPPYFGQTCRSKCNCTDDQYCHHVRGCIQPHGKYLIIKWIRRVFLATQLCHTCIKFIFSIRFGSLRARK